MSLTSSTPTNTTTNTTNTNMSSNINNNKRQRTSRRGAMRAANAVREASARRKQQSVSFAAAESDTENRDVDASPVVDDDASMSDAPVEATLTDALRKEIIEHGRHFSKIAAQFAFNNDTPSYNMFVIRFKAELENCGLELTLSEPLRQESPLSVLSQKTVYNMILHCVPTSILPSITVTLHEHSAYKAWLALRLCYIGDEATYLQGLETRFQRVIWSDDEEFHAFEVRFEQIVSELESAAQVKPDHVKKSVFMHAIESSSKKDVRGVHVFDRLNTTSKIHSEKAFKEWLVHLRVEAQQIRDAIADAASNRRSTKRPHAETDQLLARDDSTPIGSVTPLTDHGASSSSSSAPDPSLQHRPPPFHAQRRNDRVSEKSVCFNMQRTGSCRFGAKCKFSHDVPLRQVQQLHGGGGSLFQQKPRELCRMFQSGHCRFGDRCRHVHSEPSNSGGRQGLGQFGRQQLGRVGFDGDEYFQQGGGASSSSLG